MIVPLCQLCHFIEEQTQIYGSDHFYSADTFNENNPVSNEPDFLDSIGRTIYRSMAAADPEATWVMQGWMFVFNPDDPGFWQREQKKALLESIPPGRFIILDLFCDVKPQWKQNEAFFGQSWIWTFIHNAGGRRPMMGNLRVIAEDPPAALGDPERGMLVGMGMAPEGTEQNPVLYELGADMFWRDEAPELGEWLGSYARRRYGEATQEMSEAWEILERTVYSRPRDGGSPPTPVTNPPSLEPYDPRYYDPLELARVWELMQSASDRLRSRETFQYDMVNVAAQVLSNLSMRLHDRVIEAYGARDRERLRAAAETFRELFRDMDEILATQDITLLGRWITDARSWGQTPSEKTLLEWNARNQVTLWGNRESMLRDYGRKEWAGLVGEFYLGRWEQFHRELDACLEEARDYDDGAFQNELRQWEEEWTHRTNTFPNTPNGDAVSISARLLEKYRPLIAGIYE